MSADELTAYRQELASVDAELSAEGLSEEKRSELEAARDDLIELINLMESEEGEEGLVIQKPDDDSLGGEDDTSLEDDLADLIGMRCRAPCPAAAGMGLDYHAAIVLGVEGIDTERGVMLTVLYSHPLTNAMRACPHFLADTCRYGDKCKFSHGSVVASAELEDYEEPDFSQVTEGSPVLVNIDPLWEVGRVTSKDGDKLAVKILRTSAEVSSSLDQIVPIEGEIVEEEKPIGENAEAWSEQKGEACGGVTKEDLGNWQGGGIGLKLMQKMGYKKGEGLGKKSDGIVHAIQARICPKGASLDALMTKKGKRMRVVDGKTRQRLKETKPLNEAEQGIFMFLNRKLAPEDGPDAAAIEEKERKELSDSTVAGLGARSLDADRQLRDLKGKEQKLLEGIRRNAKDKNTVARMQTQLAAVQRQLERVEGKKGRIAREMEDRSQRKKDIF